MPDETLPGETLPGETLRHDGPSDGPLVTLTPAAVARVHELLAEVDAVDVRLRVAIEKAGRPHHVVSLSDETEQGDIVFEDGGVTIAVAALHASLLRGATIDYVADDDGGRFEVSNPNLVPLAMERLPRERAARRGERSPAGKKTVTQPSSGIVEPH